LLAVIATAAALGVSPATATPTNTTANASAANAPEPDHGVPPATFRKLWSGDADRRGTGEGREPTSLLALVDHPFQRPPQAVGQWTRGDHREFPTSGPSRAIIPPAADTSDRRWIRDAHITVFAVQPSTVSHPTGRTTTWYLRRSGTVLSVADYRVQPPTNSTTDYDTPQPDPGTAVFKRVVHNWTLADHGMSDIELRADGLELVTVEPSHRPRITFGGLPPATSELTLWVNVSATLNHTVARQYRRAEEVCTEDTGSDAPANETCRVDYETVWQNTTHQRTVATVVTDTIAVEVYRLKPRVRRFAFADGGQALTIARGPGGPWARATVPGGRVHTAWHFYSTRRSGWDTLLIATRYGTDRIPSDAIPLQVHAFPSTGGSYAHGDRRTLGELEVTRVTGPRRDPPQLPDAITVPAVTDPYRAPATVVVRIDRPMDGHPTVHGLVRGAEASPSVTTRREQRATTLKLAALTVNRSAGTAHVRVTLREAGSGDPIDLTDRPGAVVVHDVRLQPDADGRVVGTVPLGTGTITARYHPVPWWATDPAYAASQAHASVSVGWPAPLQVVSVGFGLVVVLSPLLFAIYVLDRLLGRRRLWPPWRGLR
jgi:hypothetical protein